MTDLLDEAVAAVRQRPADEQDAIAKAMLSMADVGTLEEIEPEHRAAVMEGLAQAKRREFASDEEVASAFSRFGQ